MDKRQAPADSAQLVTNRWVVTILVYRNLQPLWFDRIWIEATECRALSFVAGTAIDPMACVFLYFAKLPEEQVDYLCGLDFSGMILRTFFVVRTCIKVVKSVRMTLDATS